jgi:signal transduction histidine kinase
MDNQLMENLVKASPVPHAVLDHKGTVLFANDALLHKIGVHRGMVVGHAWERWLHPASRGLFQTDPYERLTADRWQGESVLVGPKGHRERVEMTLFAMAGRRYGLMLRSIEEEIEREDRYLDRIDRMDGEHRAILTDLHHGHVFDRLIRTQGFARSLSQAMANPLAYLRGDLETLEEYFKKIVTLQQAYELLIKDLRFDEQPHLLPRLNVVKSLRKRYDLDFLREDVKKVIAEAGDGIGQLTQINQALNLLRSDEEVGDLGAQVHAAIEAALLLLSGCYVSHFTVHYSGVEELPAVAMSSDRLMLMFLEVLAVAIDSLENRLSPEEGQLHIDGRVTEKGIYLSIEDSGRGMDFSCAEELFPTREKPGELLRRSYAVPMALVREAGGELEISGGHQDGTRVVITLPIEKGNPPR